MDIILFYRGMEIVVAVLMEIVKMHLCLLKSGCKDNAKTIHASWMKRYVTRWKCAYYARYGKCSKITNIKK